MPIDVSCTGCGRTLRVPETHVGKRAKCPQCETVFVVPASSSERTSPLEVEPLPSSSAAPSAFDFASETQADVRSWYVRTPDGQTYGPVPRGVLDDWADQGRVTPDSMVQSDGDAEWKPAREIFARFKIAERPQVRPDLDFAEKTPTSTPDNPYVSPQTTFPNIQPRGPGRPFYQRPHRAGLILTFGILSWVICFFFGIAAWAMGASDLKEMRHGTMDNSGYGMTQAGMIVGMIHSILVLVVFVLYVFLFAIVGIAQL